MASPSFVFLHKTAVILKEFPLYSLAGGLAGLAETHLILTHNERRTTHKEPAFVTQYLLIVGRDDGFNLTRKTISCFHVRVKTKCLKRKYELQH